MSLRRQSGHLAPDIQSLSEKLYTPMFDRLTRLFEPTPRTAEAWLVRMGRPEVSARDLSAFEAWLEADPVRLDAYQGLKTRQREARALKADLTAELAVIPRRPRTAGSRSRGIMVGGPVLAAICVAVVAVALWPRLSPLQPVDPMARAVAYSTAVGEIRDVALEDGSKVTLDTNSAIRVVLADDARHVVLDRGQAYFDVFHDAARPFKVGVADRQVTVTGTRFTTTLTGGTASVALLEGSVWLSSASGATVRMRPGDRVSYQAGRPAQALTHIDPAGTAPWRNRRLVFRDQALSEVLTELSRYTSVRLQADDPALRRLKVTAVFPLEGRGSIVDRIDLLLPVTTTNSALGVVTVRPE